MGKRLRSVRAGALALAYLLPAAAAWAGPQMGTANNTVTRSVDDAGGATSATANNQLTGSIGEEVAASTAISTNNKLRAGWPTIASYPNTLTALATRTDNTASSATFQWSTPGYDGGLGNIQLASSYILQVASYTTPSVFSNVAFVSVSVSTGGNSLPVGSGVGAGVQGLLANTTYFVQVWTLDNDGDASLPFMSTFTTLANAPVVGASEFLAVMPSSYTMTIGSVTVAWIAGTLSPPDASSMSAEGYILQASSDNFGAIALPTPAPVISSTTYNVLSSTLTVGTTAPLDLTATYYFRVASLNWSGQPNWSTFNRLNFQIQQSTGLIHFGALDPNVARSAVAASSMVVTNVGNWPVTIALNASTATVGGSPWSLYQVPGIETAVLMGSWNSGGVAPAAGAFTTFLTSTTLVSQAAGNYSGTQSGYQIPQGQSRTLWFYFTMPTTSVSLGPETIQVNPTPIYP